MNLVCNFVLSPLLDFFIKFSNLSKRVLKDEGFDYKKLSILVLIKMKKNTKRKENFEGKIERVCVRNSLL